MIPFKELKNRLKNSDFLKNPLKRPFRIAAILTEALKIIGERPVLVGGEAFEYYSLKGDYTTGGIATLIPNTNEVNAIMSELGFHKEEGFWIREDIDVLIEPPAFDLSGVDTPLIEVEIEDMHCYVIRLEDMIIDRLNSYIHWHWEEARHWIKGLLSLHGREINKEYLLSKARELSSEQALTGIFEELEKDKGILGENQNGNHRPSQPG
ncbi:MAG: hypothetical protein ACMUHX_07925 [bacterium]